MMLNAIRLAEDYGTDFKINWFPRGAAAPKLDQPADLFSDAFMAEHFIDNDIYEALDPKPLPLWRFRKDSDSKRLEAALADGNDILLDEGFEIIEFPWEDSRDLRTRFRGFISRIGFNPIVQRHIDEIEVALAKGTGRTIAYHIRRGDILNEDPWKHKDWPAKIEPDELYRFYLEKHSEAGAIVFSDQPESVERFKSSNPKVGSIDDIVDLSDCKPLQRDFLELFAMSRASEIVAPPISGFSRAAALLSGQDVQNFGNVLTRDEFDIAYGRAADRLKEGVDKFITPSEAAHIYSKVARWMNDQGRDQDAYDAGRAVLDAGADNAFVPLFHAIQCIYLGRWKEGLAVIDRALASPDMWKEQYVVTLAIRAHILGALGRPEMARRSFLRALWQKPMLPDVCVVGSFMVRRRRLKPGAALHFDAASLATIFVNPRGRNIILQQNRILNHRRAMDTSMITVDWPWFCTDSKLDRLFKTPSDVREIQGKLAERHQDRPGAGPYSFSAILEARMGNVERAQVLNERALKAAPQDGMVRKRQAEIYLMMGDHKRAIAEMQTYRTCAPDHPFWHFLTGMILEDAGNKTAALACFQTASRLDKSTPELHALVADRYIEAGQTDAAIAALQTAAELAPNQQKYAKRKARLLKRSA